MNYFTFFATVPPNVFLLAQNEQVSDQVNHICTNFNPLLDQDDQVSEQVFIII